jgi:hypothetical protein
MDRQCWRLAVVVGATFLLASGGCGREEGKQVDLKLRLRAGETYSLRYSTEQRMMQTVGGTQQGAQDKIGFDFVIEPTHVDEHGVAHVRARIAAIRFARQTQQGVQQFDTRQPPERLTFATGLLLGLVERPFEARLHPSGEVSDVVGLEEIFDAAVDAMQVPDGAMKDQMLGPLRAQFGPAAILDALQSITVTYPDHPVAIDRSWSNQNKLQMGFDITVYNTWTLKEVRDGVAVIDARSKVWTDPTDSIAAGPMKLAYDLTGGQEGEQEVDLETGWVIRGELRQALRGTVKVRRGPNGEEEAWPLSVESVTRFEPLPEDSEAAPEAVTQPAAPASQPG